jgi:MFS transporter, DHA2 family, multidrug resistance protein
VGGHVLLGFQRHRIAHVRLVSQLHRPQAAAADLCRRIHAHFVVLRVATSLSELIVFRVLQGLTGGGLQPLAQAIPLEAFPQRKHGQAMAAFGIGILLAPILGPTLGGWITDNYSWRWIFYLSLPVGVLSLLMINRFVFDPPYIRRAERRVDRWGIGFLALGLGSVQVVLDTGQRKDWFSSNYIYLLQRYV